MPGPTGVKRGQRVAERIREEIAAALARDVSDPRIVDTVVTRVEVTDDLSIAHVFVRAVVGESSEADRKRLIAGLTAAQRRLRRIVGAKLALRRAPDLNFHYDVGADASDRVGALLAEIERERRGSGESS